MNYPANLKFSHKKLEHFASEFANKTAVFWAGGIFSEESAEWNNVFQHCLSCALLTKIITDNLWPDVNIQLKQEMIEATLYHDAYKRREVEAYLESKDQNNFYFEIDQESEKWLKQFSIEENVLCLIKSFGNNAALKLFNKEETSLCHKILHLVDDCVEGDQYIGFEQRLINLSSNPRYFAQNLHAKKEFNGLTLYQAKAKIHYQTLQELSEISEVFSTPVSLNILIRDQISQYLL